MNSKNNNQLKIYLNSSQIEFLLRFKKSIDYNLVPPNTKRILTNSITKKYIKNKSDLKSLNKCLCKIKKISDIRNVSDKRISSGGNTQKKSINVYSYKTKNPFDSYYVPINTENKDEFKSEYHLYLKSDIWKKKRLYLIKKRGNKCEVCNDTKNLQIHHKTYENIFQEKESDLQVLCDRCHTDIHDY